jgi:hypothetical protein
MNSLLRAARAFRLAPRGFLASLRNASGLQTEDLAEIEGLRRFYGPPPARAGGARHLVLLSYLALPYVIKMEALFARAMQERGWSVSVLANASTDTMARGYHGGVLGCEVLRLEDYLDFGRIPDLRERVAEALDLGRRDLAAFKALTYRGAPLALHTLATLSAARPDGMIRADRESLALLGRRLRQAMLLYEAADALYGELRPTLALGVEKGFVGTCETFYAALERGVDFVQWVGCHEPDALMFKRYRPETLRDHPFSISDGNWTRLRRTPWDEAYRDAVTEDFERGYRSGAWFRYKGLATGQAFAERVELQQRLGLDAARKTAIIYSHILNDANLFYGVDLFTGGYEEWLVETVRAAAANRSVNWVLKVHPANRSRNARIGYHGEYGELVALRRAFGRVPDFLRVVTPEESVSPLSFFGLTDWGITVRGTVGLELPCFGVPVLTAGTGRYSGKGFTIDSATSADYLAKVSGIDRIAPLTEEQARLGVLYAYHVFRSRPARYGAVMSDVYERPPQHPRHRDVRFRVGSLREALDHPQVRAVAGFLESREDDFLQEGGANG